MLRLPSKMAPGKVMKHLKKASHMRKEHKLTSATFYEKK